MLVVVFEQGPEARGQVIVVVFAHQVADEVGAVFSRKAQTLLGARKLGLEGAENDQARVLGR